MNEDHALQLAHWVPETESEGPARRFALWVQGCSIRCTGCCNPALFDDRRGRTVQTRSVARLLRRAVRSAARRGRPLEGVTFLGGEPFEQALPLAAVARSARELNLGVMVFTGFLLDDLQADNPCGSCDLLAETDLLVDGPYLRQHSSTVQPWIGSSNQKFHFLTDRYKSLRSRLGNISNTCEIRFDGASIEWNGFPSLTHSLDISIR